MSVPKAEPIPADVSARWRVGIDTGGTFVDLVARPPDGARVRTAKLTRDAGAERMAEILLELGVTGPALVVHGTTHVTNAILESRFARTALVTTRGFGDVLRIGRQVRDDLYDLKRPARLPAIVPRELTFELDERCAADGTVRQPLGEDQLRDLVDWIAEMRVQAVAVCLLHSYANPEHERRVGSALAPDCAVSLSHRVSAEAREYERAAATALNAAVQHSTRAYLDSLQTAISGALPEAQLFVVQSAGGMVPTDVAGSLPIATVMSGPAAGATAVSRLARLSGMSHAVAFDMGGTSTDVSLIVDGRPAVARDRRIAGRVVRIPAIAVESIAVGGGSIVAVDDVGALTVGPRSAGAAPGPACFGRGGTDPTITDAALLCGLIGAGGEVPGLPLRRDLAETALGAVAARLGLGTGDLAWRAIDIAQGQMASVLSGVVSRRGHDLRRCTLVAYGGGGAIHAGPLAARVGIRRVVIPSLAPVFSALGCCLAEVGVESLQTHRCRLVSDNGAELASVAAQLAAAETRRIRASPDRVTVLRWLELRYRGQNSELRIPWPAQVPVASLTAAFHGAHEREYGFASEDPIEVVAVGCRLEVATGQSWPAIATEGATPASSAVLVTRGGQRRQVPVVSLGELAAGAVITGPAVIAARFGSVTVWNGQTASWDKGGNVVLEAT